MNEADIITLSNPFSLGNWFNNAIPGAGGLTIRQLLISKLNDGTLVANEIIKK
jgi:hypothetical protein